MASTSWISLQWGRTFSSAESEWVCSFDFPRRLGFNGAALFQVRKVHRGIFCGCESRTALQWGRTFSSAESRSVARRSARVGVASMGPHFFKCGKEKPNIDRDTPDKELQWGRTFSSAESHRRVERDGNTFICFNGAALFQVRKAESRLAAPTRLAGLQWGRTFSSAESLRILVDDVFGSQASMGPHFFKCGKASCADRLTHSEPSFNGAALFQVRKAALLRGDWWHSEKLQWGRTFSSAESKTAAITMKDMDLLQWGRTFSSAESREARRHLPGVSSASMGPHFFKCGKLSFGTATQSKERCASMGPHFFKCGKAERKHCS